MRIIAFKLGKTCVGLGIKYVIVIELDLEPLTSKRLYNNIAFIYKLIFGLIHIGNTKKRMIIIYNILNFYLTSVIIYTHSFYDCR